MPVPLPDLSGCDYLVTYLFDVGPVGDRAEGPISFAELESWARMTQRTLTPWELSTLRGMSSSYLEEFHAAKDPGRPAPWLSMQTVEQSRAKVSDNLRNAFRAHIEARAKK